MAAALPLNCVWTHNADTVQTGSGGPPPHIKQVPVIKWTWRETDRSPRQVSRLRMSGAAPPLPLYACVACTAAALLNETWRYEGVLEHGGIAPRTPS